VERNAVREAIWWLNHLMKLNRLNVEKGGHMVLESFDEIKSP